MSLLGKKKIKIKQCWAHKSINYGQLSKHLNRRPKANKCVGSWALMELEMQNIKGIFVTEVSQNAMKQS